MDIKGFDDCMVAQPTLYHVNRLMDETIVGEENNRMAIFPAFILGGNPMLLISPRASGKTKVADAVLDGPWGEACFNEAENRLHAQKGVMAAIIP